MSVEVTDIKNKVNLRKIFFPLTIGFAVTFYLLVSNFDPSALLSVKFSSKLITGLLIALLLVIIRDAAYIYRIREITGRKLNWWKSFEVIFLWEFGSAVTPGSVGGIALALFILKKENISYGRSTASIMLATFLDNFTFVLGFLLSFLILGDKMFFVTGECADLKGHIILQGIRSLADKTWIGFFIMALASVGLVVALFIAPKRAYKDIYSISNWRILERVSGNMRHFADEVKLTSDEFRSQSTGFYLRIFTSTIITWSARYLLANALIYAFSTVELDHLLIYGRQYVLWVYLLIPSTPGASGLAEVSFMAINCDFLPTGLSAAVAVIWRMYSYYFYLMMGILILPRWLQRVNND